MNTLDQYLREISVIARLTPDEEAELARRIRGGDEDALRRLVSANLSFVVSVARRYQGRGLGLTDLINEGNCGLLEAARRFDETRGFKFISYAVWWIRQAIIKALNDHTRPVRLPLNRITTINKVSQTAARLTQRHERKPSAQELADELDLEVAKIRDAQVYASAGVQSFDAPLKDHQGTTLLDVLPTRETTTPDRGLLDLSVSCDLQRMLSSLRPHEAKILSLCYGLDRDAPLTLKDVGRRLGLNRERVRQIRNEALATLRERYVSSDL